MIKTFFADFLVDPRKLLVGGFVLSLVTMVAHVMDCDFLLTDYLFILLCIALLLPLFSLGKVDPRVDLAISNRLGLIFLGASVVLVGYNFSQIGPPLLLQKILQGESLEKQYGFYYHHQFKLSFLAWSLFTVLIPMAFFVQSRWLAVAMVGWSVLMSTLIQIKMPFLFGFLYAALLFRLTRRQFRVLPLAITAALLLLLFIFVNSTRTSQDLTTATYEVGLSEAWSQVDPILWGPVAYLATPVANALLTIQYEPFRFDLDGILKVLPSVIVDPIGVRYNTSEKFPGMQYVRWYEASNIIAGWGHLANNLGVIGMLAFNAGVASLLVMVARKNFLSQPFLLAIFLVGCRSCALYAVEDYFFEPTLLAECLLLTACFHWGRVDYHAMPPTDADPALEAAAGTIPPPPAPLASGLAALPMKLIRRKAAATPAAGLPPDDHKRKIDGALAIKAAPLAPAAGVPEPAPVSRGRIARPVLKLPSNTEVGRLKRPAATQSMPITAAPSPTIPPPTSTDAAPMPGKMTRQPRRTDRSPATAPEPKRGASLPSGARGAKMTGQSL